MRIARPGPVSSRRWTPVTAANAVLALALELAMLAALAYWGAVTAPGAVARVALAVGAPVLAGTVWWLFLAAGGARFPLPLPAEIIVKLAVFGAAATALYGAGHGVAGLVLGALAVVSVAVEYTAR